MNSLTTYLQPVRRRMGLRLVIDRDADHRKSIFLAGTGRSGGTWLSDILNQRNEYRLVFEPFAYEPLVEANRRVFGESVLPSYDIEGAEFVISFGAEFLETWISPVRYAGQWSRMHAFRGDEAVEGIGQITVGGEAHRPLAGGDLGQARVLGQREAHAQGLRQQAVRGQRHQLAAAARQQRGGIARDHRAHRAEQTLVAILAGERAGQIDGDAEQGRPV